MNRKINILDIDIDDCTAKQAMKNTVAYMNSEPVSTVALVTVDTLMYAKEQPEFKEQLERLDMVLPGEKEILEAADVKEHKYLQEVEQQTYLKMFLRYLHKNHKRAFLLIETEDEKQQFADYFAEEYSGIQVIGMELVSAGEQGDDMIVNAVNGAEADCVIAALSVPVQEQFIARNKSLLNVGVWLGVGKTMKPMKKGFGKTRFIQFLTRRIFKKEIEKNRREMQIQNQNSENIAPAFVHYV